MLLEPNELRRFREYLESTKMSSQAICSQFIILGPAVAEAMTKREKRLILACEILLGYMQDAEHQTIGA